MILNHLSLIYPLTGRSATPRVSRFPALGLDALSLFGQTLYNFSDRICVDHREVVIRKVEDYLKVRRTTELLRLLENVSSHHYRRTVSEKEAEAAYRSVRADVRKARASGKSKAFTGSL